MSKNKLLVAISAGIFAVTAATGAVAQTPSGNSSAAAGGDTGSAAPDNAMSSTPKKHKMRKHSGHATGAMKKTPDASTGNNAAGEGGQSR